jgi:hypothetical protein
MNDDARNAPSPLWVRVLRSTTCFSLAAVISWRGSAYDDPVHSAAMPFVMCQCAALVVALIGLMNLDAGVDLGPA